VVDVCASICPTTPFRGFLLAERPHQKTCAATGTFTRPNSRHRLNLGSLRQPSKRIIPYRDLESTYENGLIDISVMARSRSVTVLHRKCTLPISPGGGTFALSWYYPYVPRFCSCSIMERPKRPRTCFAESSNQVEGAIADAFAIVLFGDFIPVKRMLHRHLAKALVGCEVVGRSAIWEDQNCAFGGGRSEFVVTPSSYESASFLQCPS
jgi:hypothetical protein